MSTEAEIEKAFLEYQARTDFGAANRGSFQAGYRACQAAAPRWIPVNERMPPTGLTVLLAGGCGFFDGSAWRTMMGSAFGKEIQWKVTHWMPLPEPPR